MEFATNIVVAIVCLPVIPVYWVILKIYEGIGMLAIYLLSKVASPTTEIVVGLQKAEIVVRESREGSRKMIEKYKALFRS